MGRLLRCLVEVERDFGGVRLAGLGGSGLFADAAHIMIPTRRRERETRDFCWVYGGIWGRRMGWWRRMGIGGCCGGGLRVRRAGVGWLMGRERLCSLTHCADLW